MSSLPGMLTVLGIWLAPLFLFNGAIFLARRIYHRRSRRNPLTRDLLRQPGHSLRELREDQIYDLLAYVAVGSALPLMLFALYQVRLTASTPFTMPNIGVYVAAGCVGLGLVIWRIFRGVRRLRDLGLGLEAEVAAGQELNCLLSDGYVVFHDVPGSKAFNVDHVLVGPAGLFAIETKGRGKAVTSDGRGHVVEVSGDRLVFPGWTETAPIAQARLNAQWLGQWLSSAVGEPVEAKPVLVIPGWYIDRKQPCNVAVVNETNAKAYFRGQRANKLSEKLVKQIVHQLDGRCRDVQARTYKPVMSSPASQGA